VDSTKGQEGKGRGGKCKKRAESIRGRKSLRGRRIVEGERVAGIRSWFGYMRRVARRREGGQAREARGKTRTVGEKLNNSLIAMSRPLQEPGEKSMPRFFTECYTS
jgi:hypothetical protein